LHAGDTLLNEIVARTNTRITPRGIYMEGFPGHMDAWLALYACIQQVDREAATDSMLQQVRNKIEDRQYYTAAVYLFHIQLVNGKTKEAKATEDLLFNSMHQLPESELAGIDLYAMQLMFPENALAKKIHHNEALKTIAESLDKQQFTKAGKLLRMQMASHPNDPTLNALYKKWLVEDYVKNYLGTETYDKLYTYRVVPEACDPGKLPDSVHNLVLTRLNYFRRLAGVPDNCIFNKEWNAKCQAAAMMMSAEGSLSHGPGKDWACYSAVGAEAAGNSNLSLGYAGSEALTGQVEDDGGNNTAVGHRRWILYPYRRVFGHGSTESAMALWALGGKDGNQTEEVMDQYANTFVAWPPEWYFPASMTPYRWSISLAGADFDKAEVTMKINGRSVPLEVLKPEYGYGLPTLVWELGSLPMDGKTEIRAEVSIKNIELPLNWDDSTQEYTRQRIEHNYTVILFAM